MKKSQSKPKIQTKLKKKQRRAILKTGSRNAVSRQRGQVSPEPTPDVEQARIEADNALRAKTAAEAKIGEAIKNLEEANKALGNATTDEERQGAQEQVKRATEVLETVQDERDQADEEMAQFEEPQNFDLVLTRDINRILACDEDYHKILDVRPGATRVEIINEWLALGCALHPDYCKIPKGEEAFQSK